MCSCNYVEDELLRCCCSISLKLWNFFVVTVLFPWSYGISSLLLFYFPEVMEFLRCYCSISLRLTWFLHRCSPVWQWLRRIQNQHRGSETTAAKLRGLLVRQALVGERSTSMLSFYFPAKYPHNPFHSQDQKVTLFRPLTLSFPRVINFKFPLQTHQ